MTDGTDKLERELSNLLHERADRVSDLVDVPDGLGRCVARRRAARRVTTGGAALLVALGVVGGAALFLRDDRSGVPVVSAGPGPTTAPTPTTSTTGTSTPDIAAGEWNMLPEAPIAARAGAAFVWSGDELIVWGGSGETGRLSDGAAYNPATRTWRKIAEAPIEGREAPASVWIGDRMFVWGGITGQDPDSYEPVMASDGALYDPVADSWEAVAGAPVEAEYRPSAVWTGREVFVGDAAGDRFNTAAYDPATRTWRGVEGPAGDAGGWSEPIVVDGELFWWEMFDGRGFAIDLQSGSWRPLAQAPSQLAGGGVRDFDPLFWTGSEVLGRGTFGAFAYDPATDSYRELPSALCGYGDALAWTGTRLLTWGGSSSEADEYNDDGVSIDPTSGEFDALPPVELEGRRSPAYAWTGEVLIVWGGTGEETIDAPTPQFRPVRLADGAAYRPPG